jgi:hypothetical protein
MSNINISNYIDRLKAMEHSKKKCYQRCLREFHKLINKNIEEGFNFAHYKLPVVIPDEPNYDMLECANYIVDKISQDRTLKQIMVDLKFRIDSLFIKWDIKRLSIY